MYYQITLRIREYDTDREGNPKKRRDIKAKDWGKCDSKEDIEKYENILKLLNHR